MKDFLERIANLQENGEKAKEMTRHLLEK